MAALVRLDGVTKRFETASGARPAVDDVTHDVEEGEVLGVIGYSGAGKSTLVRLINGLEQPTSGTVTYRGRALTSLTEAQLREERRGIGMIFQQFNLFSSRTVAGNVAFPLRLAKMAKDERDARVARMLDFVGLLDLAHAHPEELSGGQKQRVGIARALATDPRLLLADEATSALDPETTAEVLALLRRVNEELGVTIVVITHEMDAVRRVADRVAVMQQGRVVEHGAVYDVFASPASDTAARFVRSVLHDRPGAEVLRGIRERHTGRLVTVRIGEGDAGVGRVTAAFAARGVPTEIVYGGIGEVRGRTLGALTYATDGPSADVDAVLAELRAAGFVVIEESGIDDHEAGEPVGSDRAVGEPVSNGPVSGEQGERSA